MIIITSTVAGHGHLSASSLAPIDITLLLRTVISVAVKIIIIIIVIIKNTSCNVWGFMANVGIILNRCSYKVRARTWTQESKTGVNYFKHQTKHFLTPYGKTHGLLTSREILDKLFHWNCEWLTRPNYAISKLADTLYANLATLADYKDKVFMKHAVDRLLNKARPIRAVLQRFNKTDSATSKEPDERDLCDLMKFIEEDTLKGLCKHLFAASGGYVLYSDTHHDARDIIQPSGWIRQKTPGIPGSSILQTKSITRVDGCLHGFPNTKSHWDSAGRGRGWQHLGHWPKEVLADKPAQLRRFGMPYKKT